MLRKQLLALAPALLAVGMFGSGCDKAKNAAEDALGFKALPQEDIDAILKNVGWDVAKNPQLANFEVVKNGGFEMGPERHSSQ